MKRWILAAFVATTVPAIVRGEVTLDRSFGKQQSLIFPDYLVRPENGRLIKSNLFHSFEKFDIQRSKGESVTFSGPGSVTNVLVRVTGGAPANINGTILVDIPGANLFFMNPAGVLVGPDAQINLSGSLAITTADYIVLAGGGRFDAVRPENSVLTTKPPSAFGFLGSNRGAVVFTGGTTPQPEQSVPEGQSISIVASRIRIESHALIADRGRVSLITRSTGGKVVLEPDTAHPRVSEAIVDADAPTEMDDARLQAGFGGIISLRSGNLEMTDTTVRNITDDVPGGSIDIAARDITLTDSVLDANTSGNANGANVTLSGRHVLLDGHGNAVDQTNAVIAANSNVNDFDTGTGRGGDIRITAESLTLQRGAAVLATTKKNGNGGDIDVQVTGLLRIDSQATTAALTTGFQQNVQPPDDGSLGAGTLGRITIRAGILEMFNRGQITSETNSSGNAGDITIDVAGDFLIDGTGQPRERFTGVEARVGDVEGVGATGHGGTIIVHCGNDLIVRNGGAITATTFGRGDGGRVDIRAGGDVRVSGSSDFDFTGVFTRSAFEPQNGTGGRGGDVSIVANSLTLDGPAIVGADSISTGDAGTVTVRTRGPITLSNGGAITVESQLTTGGTMKLQTGDDLTLLDGARIAASANVNGGNIDIIAPRFVTLQHSEITGRTTRGDGGHITIDPKVTSLSTSTINGRAGGNDVTVQIDGLLLQSIDSQIISDNAVFSLDTDLASSLVPFNADIAGAAARLQDYCGQRLSNISSFTLTGRGGVWLDPARTTPSSGESSR